MSTMSCKMYMYMYMSCEIELHALEYLLTIHIYIWCILWIVTMGMSESSCLSLAFCCYRFSIFCFVMKVKIRRRRRWVCSVLNVKLFCDRRDEEYHKPRIDQCKFVIYTEKKRKGKTIFPKYFGQRWTERWKTTVYISIFVEHFQNNN